MTDRPRPLFPPEQPAGRCSGLADALLDRAGAAAMATAAGVLGEPSARASLRALCVRAFMRIGLRAATEARPLQQAERDELELMGRRLADGGFDRPGPVDVHAVLLAGFGEAVLCCREASDDLDDARALNHGLKRLGRLASEMAHDLSGGHGTRTGRPARDAGAAHALRELLTGSSANLRHFHLCQATRDLDLARAFPAVLVVTCGEIDTPGTRPGPRALVLPPVRSMAPGMPTHTLTLCPEHRIEPFTAWLRQTADGPSVVTRPAATLDEARQRYANVRKALPLIPAAAGRERVIDAQRLLSHRLLASLPVEVAADYLYEVLGPVLELSPSNRDALLGTLGALYDAGGVRQAACALRVHEKTIRYRIGRVHTLTGLNAMTKADWAKLYVATRMFQHFRDALVTPGSTP